MDHTRHTNEQCDGLAAVGMKTLKARPYAITAFPIPASKARRHGGKFLRRKPCGKSAPRGCSSYMTTQQSDTCEQYAMGEQLAAKASRLLF
jgi:hypothetical protein